MIHQVLMYTCINCLTSKAPTLNATQVRLSVSDSLVYQLL
jgi:hypothetical protein